MLRESSLSTILNPDISANQFSLTGIPLSHRSASPTHQDHIPRSHANTLFSNTSDMAAAVVGLPSPAMPDQQASEERVELPRPYKCPLCEKAFHRLEHQTRHIRTHTGEKPHACNYPGCSKRFSRSDELTRHLRIHTNPNSRRAKGNHGLSNPVAAAAAVHGSFPEGQAAAHVMPPTVVTWSNPGSNAVSPDVSPPQSYTAYGHSSSTPYGSYASYNDSLNHSPERAMPQQNTHAPANMNLLATAASQAALEHEFSSLPLSQTRLDPTKYPSQYTRRSPYQSRLSNSGSNHRVPSLAAYHYSQPMSRSQSLDGDHHSYRISKRSRPASPFSTAPPSPTFSAGSYSPTPGHTPAMTPGQSPRMRAHEAPHDTQLPGIRSLSLQHIHSPLLEPLEPTIEATGGIPTPHLQFYTPYSSTQNSFSSGLRISDIMNKEDGSQRKLPIPAPPGVKATELPPTVGFSLPQTAPKSDGDSLMDQS